MFIQIDQSAETPIYQQLRNEIVAGIAAGELTPGDSLPSVRALAADLGINLHTANKAYALLRDEGYVLMRGRAGAMVAPPPGGGAAGKRLADGLELLIAEFKAAGGDRAAFEEAVRAGLDRAYGADHAVTSAEVVEGDALPHGGIASVSAEDAGPAAGRGASETSLSIAKVAAKGDGGDA